MRQALARQLAVIMFTDMVGFTALAQRSERLALQLLREQRALVRRRLRPFGGREVKTIGDGFLIRFDSALHATQCALAIQQDLHALGSRAAAGERICLRIGLHLGDIERPRRDVLGDSVNLAARIQSVAPAGGVALSGIVYEHVRNQLAAPFEFRGRVALKNVARPVALFALEPAQLAALPPVQAPARRPFSWRTWVALAAAAALALLAGRLPLQFVVPATTPSVAVLPLASLGSDAARMPLADGIHEALLTHLSGLGGLDVISRTSVLEYRGAQRPLPKIAAELGARYIVEGAVQHVDGRVRVSVRLADARANRPLWADTYDRVLDDLFALQSDLAAHIAREVRTALTPDEQRRLAQVPTRNAAAYEAYLRALALEHEDRFSATALARIEALLQDAVRLDPGFALAHAALARAHVYAFDAGHDGSARRLQQAQAAAQHAAQLSPGLPEAHAALGLYHYYGHLDFGRALAGFDRALAARPGSSELLAWRGFVLRRLGRLEPALDSLQRARRLDPRNPLVVFELAATHAFLRQDAAAERVCQDLPRTAPQAGDFRAQCLVFAIRRSGNLEPAHALERDLASIANAGPDRRWVQYELAVNEGRLDDAQRHLQALSDEDLDSWAGAPPRDMLLADLARWRGDHAVARRLYRRAEERVRERIETYRPSGALVANRAFARALRGRLLARLGERAAALTEGEGALQLLPAAHDRFYGASLAEEVAKIHLHLGDHARALDQLEVLLAQPSHTHIQDLRLQRKWSELWEHPRFQEWVRRYAPDKA